MGIGRQQVEYGSAARKASSILGYIYRSIDSRSREIIILLYSGLIRPHLEYHIWFGICQYKEAINKIGMSLVVEGYCNGQGQEHLLCEERLRKLGLLSLEKRQLQKDLAAAFP